MLKQRTGTQGSNAPIRGFTGKGPASGQLPASSECKLTSMAAYPTSLKSGLDAVSQLAERGPSGVRGLIYTVLYARQPKDEPPNADGALHPIVHAALQALKGNEAALLEIINLAKHDPILAGAARALLTRP